MSAMEVVGSHSPEVALGHNHPYHSLGRCAVAVHMGSQEEDVHSQREVHSQVVALPYHNLRQEVDRDAHTLEAVLLVGGHILEELRSILEVEGSHRGSVEDIHMEEVRVLRSLAEVCLPSLCPHLEGRSHSEVEGTPCSPLDPYRRHSLCQHHALCHYRKLQEQSLEGAPAQQSLYVQELVQSLRQFHPQGPDFD